MIDRRTGPRIGRSIQRVTLWQLIWWTVLAAGVTGCVTWTVTGWLLEAMG